VQRRLTTIVAADLVGYSRLMAADEEGVVARMQSARTSLIDPQVSGAGGRIIKTMGDGLLIEFPSPVEAARACITIQDALKAQEAHNPEDQRLMFRIGINLGDVMIDGDDILGDAVNIAARLEGLSLAGGICISRTVHDQIRGKIDNVVTALGPQQVKNIPDAVDVWRVEFDGVDETKAPTRRAERPSIAVMAFDNMSSDPDQEFLVDGIVEDVITELSRFRSLHVIARNSTFAYKGSHKDVRDVAKELNVRYVVEGSVRRGGNRLRVSAQLIEANTGGHIWSERWDRDMSDLFDLQDELTRAIVTGVEPELSAHERTVARQTPTESLNAWELCQRGMTAFFKYDEQGFTEAHRLYHASIVADPEFALPHAMLGRLHWSQVVNGRIDDPSPLVGQGLFHGRRAIELDERHDAGHIALAAHQVFSGQAAESRKSLERAIALNPNNPVIYHTITFLNLYQPEPDFAEMIEAATKAIALSPQDPLAWGFYHMRSAAAMLGNIGQHTDEAIRDIEAACRFPNADYIPLILLAGVRMNQGRTEDAGRCVAQALKQRPDLTLERWEKAFSFPKWLEYYAANAAAFEALVDLGLPRE
jgi:adenylate cyclase